MNRDPKELLRELLERDFEGTVFKLTAFAQKLIRQRIWRGHKYGTIKEGKNVFILPGGLSAEDLALQVFDDIFQDRRTWDADKYTDVLSVLMKMVQSEISTILKREENKGSSDIARDPEKWDLSFEELVEEEAKTTVGTPGGQQDGLCDALFDAVQGKADLEKVIDAIMDGATKAAEVAEKSRFPVKKVYELNRQLNTIANQITFDITSRKK